MTKPKPDTKQCVHYWDIESPNGPVSKAICRKCKAKTYFKNYFTLNGPQPMTICLNKLSDQTIERLGDICSTNRIDNAYQV